MDYMEFLDRIYTFRTTIQQVFADPTIVENTRDRGQIL